MKYLKLWENYKEYEINNIDENDYVNTEDVMFNYTDHGYDVYTVEFIYGDFEEKYKVTFRENKSTRRLEYVDAETDDSQYWLQEILDCELVHHNSSTFEPNEAIHTLYKRFRKDLMSNLRSNLYTMMKKK